MKKFLLFLIVLLVSLGGSGVYIYHHLSQLLMLPITHTAEQLLTIEKGTSSKQFVEKLVQQGLLKESVWGLPYLFKLHPEYTLKAGTFSLEKVENLQQLLLLIHRGKEAQFALTLPEGSTFNQWRKVLAEAPHLQHTLKEKSEAEIYQLLHLPTELVVKDKMEGWLYPDTYYYTANSTDLAILQRAAEKMHKMLQQVWLQRDQTLPLKSAYELLILASIIEKESALASERPKIASVFINRLRKGMKLQTDPTVIYGMGERYQGNITKKDLNTDTPYNTYIINGLPPTPIAMPDKSSLEAVANPAKSDYLYFVADGSGGHKFSRTLAEHNRAVQDYLRWYRNWKKQQGNK
ncbi:endolytic transglycosylase MltG [Gallibacterium trehalosifermentans]|uniref:Endolytic murein transglycosylase n=1 Tax=Gallibacterium trehalosifermentans TaxID=516935 RepID=A0ABV6GY63_9PAST